MNEINILFKKRLDSQAEVKMVRPTPVCKICKRHFPVVFVLAGIPVCKECSDLIAVTLDVKTSIVGAIISE